MLPDGFLLRLGNKRGVERMPEFLIAARFRASNNASRAMRRYPMKFECGKCGRVLYNRRRVTCEFCGAVIPGHDRLNHAQRVAIDRLKLIEARQHREFMSRPDGVIDRAIIAFPGSDVF
jgi:ribosomal protein L37E